MTLKSFVLVILTVLSISLYSQDTLSLYNVNGFSYGGSWGIPDLDNCGMKMVEGSIPSDSAEEFYSLGWPILNGSNELFQTNSFVKTELREPQFPWPDDSLYLWVNIRDTTNLWFLAIVVIMVDTAGEGNITGVSSPVPIVYGWQKISFWVGLDHENVYMMAIDIMSFARTDAYTGVVIQFNDLEFKIETGKIMVEPFQYIWPGITTVKPITNLIPSGFVLSQNYPNPFNPNTTIRYELGELSSVKLTVYNLIGEEVAELINSEQPAGVYEVPFDARNLASGTYIYILRTEKFQLERKMVVLK